MTLFIERIRERHDCRPQQAVDPFPADHISIIRDIEPEQQHNHHKGRSQCREQHRQAVTLIEHSHEQIYDNIE
ncbi:hypothetical protein D3C73_1547910 [compost metagenome]